MPPKKKNNKKAQDDDWEAELGESVAPQDGTAADAKPDDAAAEGEVAGGGLMAALAKRGKKKNKTGANPEVEGEDLPVDGANGDDLDSKAPQEGTFDDDDDDVFAGNYGKKKGKGGAAAKAEEPVEEKTDDAPRVKTKAEKEKEKKEKEKQRKKELVCWPHLSFPLHERVLSQC
jgi:translation initiation factor 5B